jgi:exopolyphosphatase / guanosine-5'-triphosphate,3'-diphosphate pyrophosphatase
MRVATIDIGTNSVLLLVAEETQEGLHAVEERATVTRLGQGVDETRALDDRAVERTNACLADYAERIRGLGVDRVAVAGTSALRDAAGGEKVSAFVSARLGVTLRVISGREEARLMFLGAVSGLRASEVGARTAFDVGGGSTEVVRGARAPDGNVRLDYAESFDVGSVRLTERFIKSDPPSRTELASAIETLDQVLSVIPQVTIDSRPIGIAGTVTTLAAVSLGMENYDGQRAHGLVLEVSEIQRVVTLLASARLEERRRVPGLHPGRVDVIVAGGLVVLAVLRRLGATSMQVSDRGLRWGLAEELAGVGSTGVGN